MKYAALLMLSAYSLLAENLTGIWVGQIPGRNGADQRRYTEQFHRAGHLQRKRGRRHNGCLFRNGSGWLCHDQGHYRLFIYRVSRGCRNDR